MESIKEMMVRIGLDPDHIKNVEYRKCQLYLSRLIQRTEATLIKLQETDMQTEKIKSTERTLGNLIFCHNKMYEMEGIIHALRGENELLKQRIENRK
jgi:hypothetical protein